MLMVALASQDEFGGETLQLPTPGVSNARFGISADLQGDRAVVSAIWEPVGQLSQAGAVYVFDFGATSWTQTARLEAGDPQAGAEFGTELALDGDCIVVGAPMAEGALPGIKSGAAYVFEFSGGSWMQTAKLVGPDSAVGDGFGRAVSVKGGRILVGADSHAPLVSGSPVNNAGSAYVFRNTGAAWILEAKLVASDAQPSDLMGRAVSLGLDRAAIGAHEEDQNGIGAGAAYVFVRSGSTWFEEAKLVATHGTAGDRFGRALRLLDDELAVGAYLDDGALVDSGAIYVFSRSGSNWAQTAKVKAEVPQSGDGFGKSLDFGPDLLVAGTPFHAEPVSPDIGGVCIFERSGGAWNQMQDLVPASGSPNDQFGLAVALSGARLLVGAPLDDDQGSNSGSSFHYERPRAPQHSSFCFGDGSASACPCANPGGQGRGCANSVNPLGALLTATGMASLSAETLVLDASGMPDSVSLFLQGTLDQNSGQGTPFADGLLCVAGTIKRLGPNLIVSGASREPMSGDLPVSEQGQVVLPGDRTYQVWYRNPAATCTGAGSNLTNAVRVTWLP